MFRRLCSALSEWFRVSFGFMQCPDRKHVCLCFQYFVAGCFVGLGFCGLACSVVELVGLRSRAVGLEIHSLAHASIGWQSRPKGSKPKPEILKPRPKTTEVWKTLQISLLLTTKLFASWNPMSYVFIEPDKAREGHFPVHAMRPRPALAYTHTQLSPKTFTITQPKQPPKPTTLSNTEP